jgi:Protein of unknown function (DUF3800)
VLVFFDESFRKSEKYQDTSLGTLCGVGIDESDSSRVADDIFKLKQKHLGSDFAKHNEIKGKDLLKNYVFRLESEKGIASKNLRLASDLIDYIVTKRLPVFGCVCFEKGLQNFRVDDVSSLDKTFKYLFERVDMYMKIHRHGSMASIVFDDRDYGINHKNSSAITNFFQRSPTGLAMDSIVRTPFFAISQSQNVGLQLADFVTTVIGLRFASNGYIDPYFQRLRKAIPAWDGNGHRVSALKILRAQNKEESAG